MSEIERILMHPDEILDGSRPIHALWQEWINLATTRVVPLAQIVGWKDVSFLDEYDYDRQAPAVGDYLIVGGQTTLVCVPGLLNSLATHSRVYSGQVRVYVDCAAVSSRYEDLYPTINALSMEMQILINLFNFP